MKLMFNTIRQPDPEVNPKRSITFVEIFSDRGVLLAVGEAIKRPDEPFNQIVGFKYAVKNAIQDMSKFNRCHAWKSFFLHSRKTRQILNQGINK